MDTPENLIARYHVNDVYEIEARCSEERLGEVLAPFKEMAEFDFDSNDMPEGISKLILTFPKDADVAELLFKTMAKDGIPVRQFKCVVPTLEDIFLQLVAKADEEFAAREEEQMKEEKVKNATNSFEVTPMEEDPMQEDDDETEAEDDEAEPAEEEAAETKEGGDET
jgi:hypothetical protein